MRQYVRACRALCRSRGDIATNKDCEILNAGIVLRAAALVPAPIPMEIWERGVEDSRSGHRWVRDTVPCSRCIHL